MEQAAAADKKREARALQLLNAGLEEILKLRASLTPAQLAAQAFCGKGPLQLGGAEVPLSKPLVKRDRSFPDKSDPNRVQMISVFVSVVDNDPVLERRTTMQRTKDTLDYARLAKLLRWSRRTANTR